MKFFHTFFFMVLFSSSLWAYQSTEIKEFMNAESAECGSGVPLFSESDESPTVRNLLAWSLARQTVGKTEKYRILSAELEDDKNLEESDDIDLMLSAAELMFDIVYCSQLSEKISYGKKSKKLFERVLSLQPDNVSAMLGLGIGFLHTPAIFGGSNEKALEWFLKAQAAAVEPYERYAADVWLSQYYFKIDDEQNYRLFVDKAKTLFPNGYLLNQALERNENERKPL